MKTKVTIFALCIIVLGCRKDNNVSLVLNGPLTTCLPNYTCNYSYFDNADFNGGNGPVKGNYRVFWYNSVSIAVCNATSEIYFKMPINSNQLDISSSQIAAGDVTAYYISCPCCQSPFIEKPIGGEVKGKRTDATHWLINAKIVLGNSVNAPLDTLVVNQYFIFEKLP